MGVVHTMALSATGFMCFDRTTVFAEALPVYLRSKEELSE